MQLKPFSIVRRMSGKGCLLNRPIQRIFNMHIYGLLYQTIIWGFIQMRSSLFRPLQPIWLDQLKRVARENNNQIVFSMERKERNEGKLRTGHSSLSLRVLMGFLHFARNRRGNLILVSLRACVAISYRKMGKLGTVPVFSRKLGTVPNYWNFLYCVILM